MFLKKTMFRNLLKRAWESVGLTVGNDGEGIYLIGNYWTIWLESGWITNKIKSTIIEFAGELPKEGETFKCWKGQENQYEMEQAYPQELYRPRQCDAEFIDTGVSIEEWGREYRILQNRDTLESVLLPRNIVEMIDNKSVEEEEEYAGKPFGKYNRTREAFAIFWENEACVLGCMQCEVLEDSEAEVLMDLLKTYDFENKRRKNRQEGET